MSAVLAVPRRATPLAIVAALAIVLIALPHLPLDTSSPSGKWETPLPAVVLGLIQGLPYGLLAMGLILIYRTNRIINFAHGEIGAFGAAFFGIAVVQWHVPYWVAFPMGLIVAAAVGALAEMAVIRRLRKAPLLMSVVATLGIGQFVITFASALNSQSVSGSLFPQPDFVPTFSVGKLLVTPAYAAMLFLSPFVAFGLAVFLKRSRFGLALRGASANPEAARMSGIFASRMSTLAWAMAGALAAFTAILVQPTLGFSTGSSFGPSLLLYALAGAVLARMTSLPAALAGGAGLGVFAQLLQWNFPRSSLVQLGLFLLIVTTLLVQRQRAGRDEEKGSWASVQAFRPLPPAVRQVWAVRALAPATGLVALALAVVLPLFVSNAMAVTFTGIYAFAIVALSVSVVTGLGGQLSLGQFALAGVGAATSYQVSVHSGSFVLSFLYAGVVAALASLLIGLPALRIRGLLLTVTTLAFALVLPAWLLQQDWALGSGVDPSRPTVLGREMDTGRKYYYVGLAVLVLCFWLVRNIRGSSLGRILVSVRDNEDNARAFTVNASIVKITGFLVAGFIAGLGGAVYGHSLSNIGPGTFPASASIDVAVMAVIGGIGTLAGPLLGAFLVVGVPHLPLDAAGVAATKFGQLLIIMYLPSGLAGLVEPMRDLCARRLARWSGIDADAAFAERDSVALQTPTAKTGMRLPRPTRRIRAAGNLLQATDLVKSFGGVRAVRGVSFEVRAGETLGLIGPNGAGKTTTFELLSGFTRANRGTVRFDGRDITRFSPEARGELGLIRSFQDAALFPTMTVQEAVETALERVAPTRVIPSVAGWRRSDRARRRRAEELVGYLGLGTYADAPIKQLSTGTRRITEIACLVALQPTLLLLDEPSSGVAQRETEALGQLLRRLKADLGLTLVVIEHDIPLIMGLSDRIIAMADGVIIASGTPDEIRADPLVVEAYLGGSLEVIERSGTPVPAQPGADGDPVPAGVG